MSDHAALVAFLVPEMQNKVEVSFNALFAKLDAPTQKLLIDHAIAVLRGVSESIKLPIAEPTLIRPESDAILSMSVFDLDICGRTRNILKAQKIETIGDLLKLGSQELRRVPNCGGSTMSKLTYELKKHGIGF